MPPISFSLSSYHMHRWLEKKVRYEKLEKNWQSLLKWFTLFLLDVPSRFSFSCDAIYYYCKRLAYHIHIYKSSLSDYTFPNYKIFNRCKINNLINYLMNKNFSFNFSADPSSLPHNERARSNVRYQKNWGAENKKITFITENKS